MSDLIYFIDWNIIMLNGRSVIVTFLFYWMALLFVGFTFIIIIIILSLFFVVMITCLVI